MRRPKPQEAAGAIQQKFAAAKSSLMKEGGVSGLQDLGSRRRARINKMLEKRKRAIGAMTDLDPEDWKKGKAGMRKEDKEAQINGINTWQAMNEAENMEAAADEGYKRDFLAWLMGKGKEEDHRRTPWYRSDWMLRHLDDVRAWVETFVDVIYETESAMIKLALNGPTNLQEADIYYKYIVNLDWMRRDDKFFFVDMVELINGGMVGGGLTEDELNVMNLRTHIRHGKYKDDRRLWNEQAATQEDVFRVSETLRKEAEETYKRKGETLLEKIDAIHRNALEPMHPTPEDSQMPASVVTLNFQEDQHATPEVIEERERLARVAAETGGSEALVGAAAAKESMMKIMNFKDRLMSEEVLANMDASFFVGEDVGLGTGMNIEMRREQMEQFLVELESKKDITVQELGRLLLESRERERGVTGKPTQFINWLLGRTDRQYETQLNLLRSALRTIDTDEARDAWTELDKLDDAIHAVAAAKPIFAINEYFEKPGIVNSWAEALLPWIRPYEEVLMSHKRYAEILKQQHPELAGALASAALINAYRSQADMMLKQADAAFDAQMAAVVRGDIVNPYLHEAARDPKRFQTLKSLHKVQSAMELLEPIWKQNFQSMDARVFNHIEMSKVWSELVTRSFKQSELDAIKNTLGFDMKEIRQHSDFLRVTAMMGNLMGNDESTKAMTEQFKGLRSRMWAQKLARSAPALLFLDNLEPGYYSETYTINGQLVKWDDVKNNISMWGVSSDTRMANWQKALYWHALETVDTWSWAQNLDGNWWLSGMWKALSGIWGVAASGLRIVGNAVYVGYRLIADLATLQLSGTHTISVAYYALSAAAIFLGGTSVGPKLAEYVNLLSKMYLSYQALSWLKYTVVSAATQNYVGAAAGAVGTAAMASWAFPAGTRGSTQNQDMQDIVSRQRSFYKMSSAWVTNWAEFFQSQTDGQSQHTLAGDVAVHMYRMFLDTLGSTPLPNLKGVVGGTHTLFESAADVLSGLVATTVNYPQLRDHLRTLRSFTTDKVFEGAQYVMPDLGEGFNDADLERMSKDYEDMHKAWSNVTTMNDELENFLRVGTVSSETVSAITNALKITTVDPDAVPLMEELKKELLKDSPDRGAMDAALNNLRRLAAAKAKEGVSQKWASPWDVKSDIGQNYELYQKNREEFARKSPVMSRYFDSLIEESRKIQEFDVDYGQGEKIKVTGEALLKLRTLSPPETQQWYWETLGNVVNHLGQGRSPLIDDTSKLLHLYNNRPEFKQQVEDLTANLYPTATLRVDRNITEAAANQASQEYFNYITKAGVTRHAIQRVGSLPEGREKKAIVDVLRDVLAAGSVEFQGNLQQNTIGNGREEQIKGVAEKRGVKEKDDPYSYAEYASATGVHAAAFDLMNGKDGFAYQLLMGGEARDRFKQYQEDWREKDEIYFDPEYKAARERELAWKDTSYNRAIAGSIFAMSEMSRSQNVQFRSAVVAKLFGYEREYKFLRTNLVARMGFTGFSGIHVFLGRGKRLIRKPWKKGEVAKKTAEPTERMAEGKEGRKKGGKKGRKGKKDHGMPQYLGLKKHPETKDMRRKLKKAARVARSRGMMDLKSTANAYRRALKWGFMKAGSKGYSKMTEMLAGLEAETLPTHEDLFRQALGAGEAGQLEDVQRAIANVPDSHEELFRRANNAEVAGLLEGLQQANASHELLFQRAVAGTEHMLAGILNQ